MPTVWDAAEMLLRMAGTGNAALAAARGMSAICREAGDEREAAFWLAVADAIQWVDNPQPLIAPEPPPERRGVTKFRRRREKAKLVLPARRGTVLRFRRQLRELWERYQNQGRPTASKDDDRE
jgi:hypothetical protein